MYIHIPKKLISTTGIIISFAGSPDEISASQAFFFSALGTMDQLEQEVSQHLKDVEKTGKDDWEAFQGLLEDLLHLAWRRENRQRVVLFLGNKLQSCSQNAALKDAARIICEHLCLVSWASSMVDVEYYRCLDLAACHIFSVLANPPSSQIRLLKKSFHLGFPKKRMGGKTVHAMFCFVFFIFLGMDLFLRLPGCNKSPGITLWFWWFSFR